jgi:hypothetical protein
MFANSEIIIFLPQNLEQRLNNYAIRRGFSVVFYCGNTVLDTLFTST